MACSKAETLGPTESNLHVLKDSQRKYKNSNFHFYYKLGYDYDKNHTMFVHTSYEKRVIAVWWIHGVKLTDRFRKIKT